MEELRDTIELMCSDSYIERFIAEYQQTKIRYNKLKKFNNKIEAARIVGKDEPTHDCPLNLLTEQQRAMGNYLRILELRAEIEKININEV